VHDDEVRFVLLQPAIEIVPPELAGILGIGQAKDVIHVTVGVPADRAGLDRGNLCSRRGMRVHPPGDRNIVCISTLPAKIELPGHRALHDDTREENIGRLGLRQPDDGIDQEKEEERSVVPVIVRNVEEDIKRQQADEKRHRMRLMGLLRCERTPRMPSRKASGSR
jgi:hypothetical protein